MQGEGGKNLKSNIEIYTLLYIKQIASGNLLYDTGSSNSVFCDNLEGRIGMGSGSMVQEGEVFKLSQHLSTKCLPFYPSSLRVDIQLSCSVASNSL